MTNKMEETIVRREGGRYVKRMMERKKETSKTSVNQVQCLKTKITVLESLQPSVTFPGKTLENDKFINRNLNRSYPSGKENRKGSDKFLSNKKISLGSKILQSGSQNNKENIVPNIHHIRPASAGGELKSKVDICYSPPYTDDGIQKLTGFHYDERRYPRDFLAENMKQENDDGNNNLPWDEDHIDERLNQQSRVSVGKYFKAKSQTEMLNFHNALAETNEENENPKFNRRESQKYFGARVLSVLEPEVEQQNPKSEPTTPSRRRQSEIFLIQESFKEYPSANDSEGTSVIYETSQSEDLDINDSEERWKLVKNIVDKGVCRNSTNKDFDQYTTTDDDYDPQIFETPARTFSKDNRTNNLNELETLGETFYTFTSPKGYNIENSDREDHFNEISPTSFFQRNTPIHESTRKFFDKTNLPQIKNTTVSTPTQANSPMMTTVPDIYQTACQENTISASTVVEKDPTVPYEVENFLKTALGDEHLHSNETYVNSIDQDKSNSSFNITELMSVGETFLAKKNNEDVKVADVEPKSTHEANESTNDFKPSVPDKSLLSDVWNSSTMDATRTFCRTLTKKLRKSLQLKIRHKNTSFPEHTYPHNSLRKQRIKELEKMSEIEEKRIEQACKAVDACKSSERFATSQERLEAERFLIQISLTKSALLNEMGRIACQKNPQQSEDGLPCERGRITVTDLSVSLREEQVRFSNPGEPVEWFIVVVRSGLFVWVSHAVPCPMSGPVYFPGEVSIPDLAPDFQLSITIFSTVLEQTVQGKYDTINGRRSEIHKLKDKIFLRKSTGRRRMSLQCIEKSKKSSFVQCGTVNLTLNDIKLTGPWTLNKVPAKSILNGILRLKLRCDLQLTVKHTGFITYASNAFFLSHGDQSPSIGAWNRRWCLLKGQTLQLWNYPDEQEDRMPIFSIDLGKCVSDKASMADRTICARSRTLIIETCWRRNEAGCQEFCSHTRHFLSFDSTQELKVWQSKLNHIISSLLQWNVIKTSN